MSGTRRDLGNQLWEEQPMSSAFPLASPKAGPQERKVTVTSAATTSCSWDPAHSECGTVMDQPCHLHTPSCHQETLLQGRSPSPISQALTRMCPQQWLPNVEGRGGSQLGIRIWRVWFQLCYRGTGCLEDFPLLDLVEEPSCIAEQAGTPEAQSRKAPGLPTNERCGRTKTGRQALAPEHSFWALHKVWVAPELLQAARSEG